LFVDHLRAALTILVVLHHLAVIYGANAPFYYVEPPTNDPLAFLVLILFVLVNQAYFMGFFFLLSGYFTPASFDRRGPASFLRDRLIRLGIPLVVFVLVLNPIASIGLYQMPAEWTGITTPFTWQQYPSLLGVGPLWFAEMLLIFAFGYAAWRSARRSGATARQAYRATYAHGEFAPPSYRAIGAFCLVLAVVSYLLRIVVPLGLSVPVLGFPTLAYLPQYLSFFVIGMLAFRRNWFQTIPASMGRVGLAMALVASLLLLLPLALSGDTNFIGGGHWESAVYALWDSVFSVGMCLALITFFRHFFNHQGSVGRFLAQHAFTVYIIHAPIIVLLALALRGIQLEQLAKFGLAAVIGVPLCFAVAFLVRSLPLAARVL
jgi:glucans biosynthesis protein C